MTDDSAIYLLPHAGALTGAEFLVLDQFPFGAPGSTVNLTLNELVTYVTDNIVVGGDITGTLTPGKYPVAIGTKSIGDGRISNTTNGIRAQNVSGASYLDIGATLSILKYSSGSVLSYTDVSSTNAQLGYQNASYDGQINIQDTLQISHSVAIHLLSPDIAFDNLTANSVVYLDSGKTLRSVAFGTNGQVPTIVSGALVFATPSAGGTYTNGAGLTLASNQFSIGSGQVINSMIANSTINLGTKVTSVLKYVNGGTQTNTVPETGAAPYAGAAGYAYDKANYWYDPATKALNINNIVISPDDGLIGINIEGAGNAIQIKANDPGFDAIIITAKGNGIKADSATGLAGRFTSSESAAEFNQSGIISADVDYEGVTVNRNFTRATSGAGSSSKATGPMLCLNDTTIPAMGTGPFMEFYKKNTDGTKVSRFKVGQDGTTYYQKEADIKVSVSGSIISILSGNGTIGSTATAIFSSTIKANTLSNDGDEVFGRYYFSLNQTTKTKGITVKIGATTIFTAPSFALASASVGFGRVEVSIMRFAANYITYSVEMRAYENGTSIPLAGYSFAATGSFTLTTDNLLNVIATCESGSADGGVIGVHGKVILNPNF
jgi:hypothetical protein